MHYVAEPRNEKITSKHETLNHMTKKRKCRYCGTIYSSPGACPGCKERIRKHHNKQAMFLLRLVVIVPLLVALFGFVGNLRFLSNTVETTGRVIKVDLESGGSGMHRGLSHTADIEYFDHLGQPQIIHIRPVILDVQWFNYGETVPIRYSMDGRYEAQTTKFWFFWNTTWVSLLIAAVYGFFLYLAKRWQ